MGTGPAIRTPDQRLRVFISSTLQELAPERAAARSAVESLRLTPVLFELGARPHPPRELYRAYLEQSDVFVGLYWERYGWVAPDEDVSGLEDEYRLAGDRPRLLYLKEPAQREDRLVGLIQRFQADDLASYRTFTGPDDLAELLAADLAVLLSERFVEPDRAAVEPGPLPLPLSETIGRDQDVAEVVDRLDRGSRLVTVSGPGGVGKTRLCLEVARLLRNRGTPVWFIGLADVRDAGLVLPAIAEEVAARAEGTLDLAAALHDVLAGRGAVLVLDNLEQIAGAGTAVLDLVHAVDDLRVVTTSRRPLRVDGEAEVRLAPLELPGPDGDGSSAALELFVARARAADPTFSLHGGNRSDVRDLVRRLDGLPLALELAAARTRILTPAQILDRLEEATVTDDGARPERHRSIRSTIAWSDELLDHDARRRLADLSVFAGGWTLAAAEAITGGGAAVDDLAALLDHSLIRPAAPGADAPRFDMLESVRQYARERLEASGDPTAQQRRHLEWFRAVGDEAQPFLCGPNQDTWVRRLDPERANLREAVANALAARRHADVVELTWDVIVLYFVRDAVHEPDGWLDRVATDDPALDEVSTAKLRSLRALTRLHHGDPDGAWDALAWSLGVFDDLAMDFEAAVTLKELAFLRFTDGDPTGAVADLERSSDLFAGLGHDWGVALAQTMLGTVHAALDDPERADGHLRRAVDRAEAIDNRPLLSQALCQLAFVQVWEGRPDASLDLLGQAAGLVRAGGFRADAAACLDAVAGVALARDHQQVAREALRRADQERSALGVVLWPTVQQAVDALRARAGVATAATEAPADLFASLDRALDAVRQSPP